MLLHFRTIFTLSCCLSVVRAGRNTQTACQEEKSHVLACEQSLIGLVNAQLTPYNKTFNSIDLDNDTESELLDEKTRDVVCSTTNVKYVSCMVDNVTACPHLAEDEDIISTWIASLIAPNLDILNSTQRVCEFFEDSVCSYREIKLSNCYNSIVGEVVTVNENVDMCALDKREQLTCMVEIYKECKRYINLTSNEVIAANIRSHMIDDQWDAFNTGSELCDCYEGEICYSALNQEITESFTTSDSVRDKYMKIVALSEYVCSNITRVNCAKKGQPKTCLNIVQNYSDYRAKIDVYTKVAKSICHIINTKDFKTHKQCIIEKLTDSYQPCTAEAHLPENVNTCREFQKLYKCVSRALKGQCNGEYTNAVYGMIRTSLFSTIECDVTSGAFAFFPPPIVLLFIFMFVIHFVYFYSGK